MVCPVCGQTTRGNESVCTACGALLSHHGAAFAEAVTGYASIPDGHPTTFPASLPSADQATGFPSSVTGFPSNGDKSFTSITMGFPTSAGDTPDPDVQTSSSDSSDETGPLAQGQSFGSRYHIIRLLGAGGMGAVYQAWDAELSVSVAIKVIRPDIVADPQAAAEVERRFKRELLLARQVTHKNVVRIYDLGEIDGIKYITMAYVNGVDLGTMLKRDGSLPIDVVLPIVRSIASGLSAAHTAGVVHRDLKPANIIIEKDGEALIMDFGIARSSGGPQGVVPRIAGLPAHLARGRGHAPDATRLGVIVGTVEYMAPEQAKGQAVDQRADIYALGLILYDALVGRRRSERAESAVAELQGRMQHPPPPARSIVPTIPEALERIISRCLEPDPAKRYQTTLELVADLERIDDNGEAIRVRRVVGMRMFAAIIVVALLLLGASWRYATMAPPPPPDPVSVVIADFENATGDATFDHTLEPTLRRALEDATFVSAYDRSRIRSTFGVPPPEKMNEGAAREIAVKQGLGVVVSGSIDDRGSGYEISVKATQAISGDEIIATRGRASSKDEVLNVATRLVTDVRSALGDETSDSAQMFAMRSVSATSPEVLHHYAAALEAQSNARYEEARASYLKALELDPKFGLGYQGVAVMSRTLGNQQDADKYIQEALKYLEGMTERERFSTRAFQFRMSGDFQQCVNEYSQLTARYAADAIAHNNRALCLSKLRKMRETVDAISQAVKILPKRMTFRGNLAVYSDYAGDFQAAEREARSIQEPYDLATLALAFAQLGQGQLADAGETYRTLAPISRRGASWAASGLADLALYEGRAADAVRLFEQGAVADLAAKNADKAARKLTSLASAHLLRGRTDPAIAAAEKALATSRILEIRFLAARIFAEAGAVDKARPLADEMAAELSAEPQAYGKIVEGEIALKNGDPRQAIRILTDANTLLDTWLGHFALGRAYLEAGALVQADSEFERCISRRGEALSLLVDEEPTFGYFPPVYYYQGLVREGLKNAGFADSYRAYLDIRGKSTEDPLLPEIRKRAGI